MTGPARALALSLSLAALAALAPVGAAAADRASEAPYQSCWEAKQLQAGWAFLGDYVRVRRRYDDRRELMADLRQRTQAYAEGFTRVKSQRLWDRKKAWEALLALAEMGKTPPEVKRAADGLARGLADHYDECMRP
jgi:hypothetical protein